MTTASDSAITDARHLLDLLNMLPDRESDGGDYWAQLADAELGPQRQHEGHDYFLSKMDMIQRDLRKAVETDSTKHHEDIGQYLLMFFDRSDEDLWRVLDRVAYFDTATPGRIGRRWAADVTATAWRMYVASRGASRR